ncbi:hypothetical protein FKM82_005155 [Ascaphus truei]
MTAGFQPQMDPAPQLIGRWNLSRRLLLQYARSERIWNRAASLEPGTVCKIRAGFQIRASKAITPLPVSLLPLF